MAGRSENARRRLRAHHQHWRRFRAQWSLGSCCYNAAKGGVHGLTTGLAREFARDGVTVNTVAPCAVNTPQMQAVVETNPALAAKFVSVIPVGRPAELEEVASMVSYLSSEEAAFVTGQVISVNGGSTMLKEP